MKTKAPTFGEEFALAWAVKNNIPKLVETLYNAFEEHNGEGIDVTVKDVYTDLNIL